ncbi:hypothetical protein NGRA_2798 [Nosema granulosis]|uniref:Uncharacterized protein n=1 Tax=Nosema granulosis TaxID=83296 RepID=A0A9P6GVZ7_9MICR|nr:hypothetical protein NGRA_2798 [Nosema granulosis]
MTIVHLIIYDVSLDGKILFKKNCLDLKYFIFKFLCECLVIEISKVLNRRLRHSEHHSGSNTNVGMFIFNMFLIMKNLDLFFVHQLMKIFRFFHNLDKGFISYFTSTTKDDDGPKMRNVWSVSFNLPQVTQAISFYKVNINVDSQ